MLLKAGQQSWLCFVCFHRYMMLIDGKNEVYMIDRDNSVFHIANLEFPFRKDLRIHLSNTLLDGVSYCNVWKPVNPFRKRGSTLFLYLMDAHRFGLHEMVKNKPVLWANSLNVKEDLALKAFITSLKTSCTTLEK